MRSTVARQAMWLTVPFGVQQVLRLGINVALAWLLAPEIFGVMVLITTLKTGTELLSDIGIGQSVVRSPHAHDTSFIDSAWTLQLVRGVALTIIALLAAQPIATAYGNPEVGSIIALVSVMFLFTGLQSPDIFLMQRDMRLRDRGIYDVGSIIIYAAITIPLAWWWADVWALVWGLVLSGFGCLLLTYAFAPLRIPKLRWDSAFTAEIFHFGKWIFLSTALYFAAISTDKIYFSAVLPLAVVGIYGVSRTFSDLVVALAQRLGSYLVFPRVVELRARRAEVAPLFQRKRRLALIMIGAGTACGLAISDQLILLLYDQRYHAAAFMLPVLLAGAWFSVLASFNESTLLGLDRPRASAAGNGVKFVAMLAGLIMLVPVYGIFAGLLVLIGAEFVRWVVVSWALQSESMASIRDDVVLTLLVAICGVALKMALAYLGLVPDLQQWWQLGNSVHR